MIKPFPIERYKFHIDEQNKVIVATSTFAKKTYRGVARCSQEDKFDIEFGKRLAATRCGLKIARARVKAAQMNLYQDEAYIKFIKDIRNLDWCYLREAEEVERKIWLEAKKIEGKEVV